MKKATSAMLALSMALALSGSALASNIPSANVNPQQKGHVAYMESEYGKQRAQEIINGYGRAQEPPKRYNQVPAGAVVNPIIYIPSPTPTPPVWGNLRVGDYFVVDGQRYIVGRITVITGSQVLIAYPVNSYGVPDYMNPRYFYI